MYALIQNNLVAEYPVTLKSLKKRNPSTSFPKSFDDFDYTQYGVVKVVDPGTPDIDYTTHKLANEVIQNINGVWTITYQIEALTAEELETQNLVAADRVRTQRNEKLAESDWTQLADSTADANTWATYRQALRDIPSSAGFPNNVTWPEPPAT